jgi:hypothetical protein
MHESEEVHRDVATVIVRVGWNFGLSNFVITSRGEASRGDTIKPHPLSKRRYRACREGREAEYDPNPAGQSAGGFGHRHRHFADAHRGLQDTLYPVMERVQALYDHFAPGRENKGFSLSKVPDRKRGFVFYVRYYDKGAMGSFPPVYGDK